MVSPEAAALTAERNEQVTEQVGAPGSAVVLTIHFAGIAGFKLVGWASPSISMLRKTVHPSKAILRKRLRSNVVRLLDHRYCVEDRLKTWPNFVCSTSLIIKLSMSSLPTIFDILRLLRPAANGEEIVLQQALINSSAISTCGGRGCSRHRLRQEESI